MSLPNDVALCAGIGSDADGWFEDCEDCARRTEKPTRYAGLIAGASLLTAGLERG